MNKEVNHVLQGFLLTLLVIGAFKFGGVLLSIPPPPDEPEDTVGFCGNVAGAEPPLSTSGAATGKQIFYENCASCHSLHKDLTGPALAGVSKRIPDKKLLYKWIRNPVKVLMSGNVYFNTLRKRFGGVVMTSFNQLSDKEIDAILEYIDLNSR